MAYTAKTFRPEGFETYKNMQTNGKIVIYIQQRGDLKHL